MVALPDLPYSPAFYRRQSGGSLTSAEVVLPIVFEPLHPKSVLDIGCGVGTWLAAARKLGAERLVGYEGEHMTTDKLIDSTIDLRRHNLETYEYETMPRVDLAMSLEFGEHLGPAAGDRLVTALCGAADTVLFGAAIPGQGGRHHVNEQWPSYWMKRFADHGFAAYDVIRPRVWDDDAVEPWYAQNTFLYLNTRTDHSFKVALHASLGQQRANELSDAVCPRMWAMAQGRLHDPAVVDVARYALMLPGALIRRFGRWLAKPT